MIKVSTSILSSSSRIELIKALNNTDTDYIHIDVMDNKFVPNYQLPIDEINELNKYTKKPLDIHLMVENPKEYIKSINGNNIHNITIHVEVNKDINHLINLIKTYNYKVGLAIKPNTNPNKLNKYINNVDMILVMSVEPGFGGQKFIDKSIKTIEYIRKRRQDIIIEVDGGINSDTINKVKNNIDIAVAGSYITNSNNYQKAIISLKK